MIASALIAALLAAGPSRAAEAVAAAPQEQTGRMSTGGTVNMSLIEALQAIDQPELAGLFSFIPEKESAYAFSDLVARQPKKIKKYVGKLDDDREVANGLTAWDHEVCASLVNLYGSPAGASFARPKAKLMSKINNCVLAPVVPLQEIVSRRRR